MKKHPFGECGTRNCGNASLRDGGLCVSCVEAKFARRNEETVGLIHYILVRGDVPPGVQLAQAVHAAGESADPRPAPGTIAVVLAAKDKADLISLGIDLNRAGIDIHKVHETSSPYNGDLMAIGLYPISVTDREALRPILGHLPLAG